MTKMSQVATACRPLAFSYSSYHSNVVAVGIPSNFLKVLGQFRPKRIAVTVLNSRPSSVAVSPISPSSSLLVSLATTVGFQGAFFLIASRLRTDRFTDLAGTSNIAILALLALARSPFRSLRHVSVTAAVVTWAARLGFFLVRRIARWKSDRRFDQMRGNPAKFAMFWTLQATWVWVSALPATYLASATPVAALRRADIIGIFLYAAGLLFESVADAQKPSARVYGWPESGLWRFSRHPNYFGEILVWWGVYALALPDLHSAALPALASPLLVSTLLMFISGVPILEHGANTKYGRNEAYQAYKRKTSILLPMPPSLYERLPDAVKKWVLLDFPWYNTVSDQARLDDTEEQAASQEE